MERAPKWIPRIDKVTKIVQLASSILPSRRDGSYTNVTPIRKVPEDQLDVYGDEADLYLDVEDTPIAPVISLRGPLDSARGTEATPQAIGHTTKGVLQPNGAIYYFKK
jgi:hypothetical protein